MVLITRVDERLLHGQTAASWIPAIGADCILIANDSVVQDNLKKTAMKLAKPSGTKLVMKSIEDSIQALNSGVTDKYKLLVVVESVRDAHSLAKQCEVVKSVNLGGSKIKEDSKKLDVAFYVTNEECTLLREMLDDSVELEIRQVPEDKKKMVTKEMLS